MDIADIRRIYDKPAKAITDKLTEISRRSGRYVYNADNEKKLSLLNPGRNAKGLIAEYYRNKVVDILLALSAVAVLLILLIISRLTSRDTYEDNLIRRHEAGGGDYSVELDAGTDDYDYGRVRIDIEERHLSEGECHRLMDELYESLMMLIAADNEDLNRVDSDLYMPVSVEGYPFTLRWESSDYALIDSGGHVDSDKATEEGIPADIRVYMTYRDIERAYDYKVVVYPVRLEGAALKLYELKELMRSENSDSADKEYYRLPEYIDGERIDWREYKEPVVPVVIVIAVCLMLGIWLGTDRDLKKRYEERNRRLTVEYADFISKLQILLSSGQTIRGALERMVADYRKAVGKGGETRYVYEELSLCTRKLKDGQSEAECYEYFGKRCNVLCYRKLTALLIQNLRKGTDGLIEAMDNEVHMAFEERKAMARRMGEEAQTKLILPMMLMLSVVMIIIMIPAYLSFGGM